MCIVWLSGVCNRSEVKSVVIFPTPTAPKTSDSTFLHNPAFNKFATYCCQHFLLDVKVFHFDLWPIVKVKCTWWGHKITTTLQVCKVIVFTGSFSVDFCSCRKQRTKKNCWETCAITGINSGNFHTRANNWWAGAQITCKWREAFAAMFMHEQTA